MVPLGHEEEVHDAKCTRPFLVKGLAGGVLVRVTSLHYISINEEGVLLYNRQGYYFM